MHIKEVRAHIIKNSRGEKAIEIIVNKKYKASAASGASTGKHEVPCFSSQGIEFSVTFIPLLGGNAVVALQGACLQAMAHGNVAPYLSSRLRFPVPLGNCVGGGAHSKGIGTDIQEFLLLPKMKTMKDRVFLNRHVYDLIGKITKIKKKTDEGAFILQKTNENVFLFLSQLLDEIKKEGYSVQLGVDVAASRKSNSFPY